MNEGPAPSLFFQHLIYVAMKMWILLLATATSIVSLSAKSDPDQRLTGTWQNEEHHILLTIEETNDGIRVRRNTQDQWYTYLQIRDRQFRDRQGNIYYLNNKDQILSDGKVRKALAHLVDAMPGFGLACRHVGLDGLEDLFVASSRRLAALVNADEVEAARAWLAWPRHWQRWFAAPEPESLARAMRLHEHGSQAHPSLAAQVRSRLSELDIRAEAPPLEADEGPVDPWSRAIPAEADPEV